MRDMLLVALGGAFGAAARWAIGEWAMNRWRYEIPWHTFAINVGGALLLGVLIALTIERGLLSPEWRLLLGVGVLGGFTTFSTLSYETVALVERGLVLHAAAYALGSCAAGVLAVVLGLALGRSI